MTQKRYWPTRLDAGSNIGNLGDGSLKESVGC